MNTFLLVSTILLWCLVIGQLFLFVAANRNVVQFLKRFPIGQATAASTSLLLGAKAPLFSEEDQDGQIVTLNKCLFPYTLLLFTYETCSVCQKLIAELQAMQVVELNLRLIVVANEDLAAPPKPVPAGVSFLRSNSIMENYLIQKTPYFVLINQQGYLVDMGGVSTLSELLQQVAKRP